MNKPLSINLQINVYADGTVTLGQPSEPVSATPKSSRAASQVSTPEIASTKSDSEPKTESSTTSPAAASAASGETGPSESDVRTALLAAVKASDKAKAVGVLESIAGVTRVPDVPAEHRAAVIEALNALATTEAS